MWIHFVCILCVYYVISQDRDNHSIFIWVKEKFNFSGNLTALIKKETHQISQPEDKVKIKFKTSDATAAVWSDNIYGKWTGLAKQHPEKCVYDHD